MQQQLAFGLTPQNGKVAQQHESDFPNLSALK
jgi:hypothetical protein